MQVKNMEHQPTTSHSNNNLSATKSTHTITSQVFFQGKSVKVACEKTQCQNANKSGDKFGCMYNIKCWSSNLVSLVHNQWRSQKRYLRGAKNIFVQICGLNSKFQEG